MLLTVSNSFLPSYKIIRKSFKLAAASTTPPITPTPDEIFVSIFDI